MGSEWKETTIGNIAAKGGHGLVDGPFGSNLPASSYTADGIPVIRGSNLTLGSGRFKGDEFVYVSDETADRLSRSLCKANDIVFTKKGTLGQTGLVPDDGYESYLISSNQMKLTVDTDIALPLYVYYFVSSQQSTEKIIRDSESTGVPKTNLAYLKDFPISLPPLEKQKRIAHVLGSLDDKIALNRQINTTLESMAQALFKSWFVNFDPVIDNALAAGNDIPEPLQARAERRKTLTPSPSPSRGRGEQAGIDAPLSPLPLEGEGLGEGKLPLKIQQLFPDSFVFTEEMGWVPEGWGVGVLEDLLVLQRGFDLPKSSRTDGEYPLIAASGQDGTHNESKVSGPGITTGRSGKLGEVCFVEKDFWPLNTTLWVKEFRHSSPYHAFYLLKSMDLEKYNSGSAVPTLNRNYVHNVSALLPSGSVIEAYDQFVSGCYSKKHANDEQSKSLSSLRDSLLPKLLSGQLSIPEAEQALDKVV